MPDVIFKCKKGCQTFGSLFIILYIIKQLYKNPNISGFTLFIS